MKIESLAFFLLGATAANAAAPAACCNAPYKAFLPLSSASIAQQYCSSRYPQATVTSTKTAPVKTITTSKGTTTITKASGITTSTTTVATNTVASTVTTTTSTPISTVIVTSTIDFSANPAEKRAASTPAAYTTLTRTVSSVARTICLCIQSAPTTTVTITPSVYKSVTTTTYTTTPSTTIVSVTATSISSVTAIATTDTALTTSTVTSMCPSAAPTACGSGDSVTCNNLQTDKYNCGACGNKCATGLGCNAGQCSRNNACDFQGSIQYCYGGTTCVCYQSTEGNGFCGDPYGACGPVCSTSDDCSGNNVCLTAATVGCAESASTCSVDGDLSRCPNPSNGFRFFRSKMHKRTESHRRLPGDDTNVAN